MPSFVLSIGLLTLLCYYCLGGVLEENYLPFSRSKKGKIELGSFCGLRRRPRDMMARRFMRRIARRTHKEGVL
jgi:hypothetical protein